jgi:hypothetical protein
MTGPELDIDTALSGDGTIPSEQVLSWIDAAADSDLPTLSKLYRLTGEGYYRIQPELGSHAVRTCLRNGQRSLNSRLVVTGEVARFWPLLFALNPDFKQ